MVKMNGNLDSRDILKRLTVVKNLKKSVTLFNIFKGIPISYNASVLNVDEGKEGVSLEVHKYQAVALDSEKRTQMRCGIFPKDIQAKVSSVEIKKALAALSDFAYTDAPVAKREFVRVHPPSPLETFLLTAGKEKIKAALADLSMTGMGVNLKDLKDLKESADIQLFLKLTPEKEIKLYGKIVKIAGAEGSFRLGLKVFPDSSSEILISQYITKRQKEIMEDLRNICF